MGRLLCFVGINRGNEFFLFFLMSFTFWFLIIFLSVFFKICYVNFLLRYFFFKIIFKILNFYSNGFLFVLRNRIKDVFFLGSYSKF